MIMSSLGGASEMSYLPGKSNTLRGMLCSLNSKLSTLLVSSSIKVSLGFIFWKITLAMLVLPTLGSPIRQMSISKE